MTKRRRAARIAVVTLVLLAALAAMRVAFWGRPVPRVFHWTAANQWTGAAGERIEAQDSDSDGTWDRFTRGGAPWFSRPDATSGGTRLLIVCLDGVPYSRMREAWQAGHFREFFPPVQVISTFPSESEVALTAFFSASPAHGYENRYFDRRAGKIAGGVSVTLSQSAPYLRFFDYDEPAIFKGIHYVVPTKTFRADIGRLRKRFIASQKPVFVAHISSTDGLLHITPPARTPAILAEIEQVIRDLYFEAGGKLRVLLFSDHGNNQVRLKPAPLKQSLERAGFNVGSKLSGPRDVAIPQFGLVSFAAIYTQPAAVAEVARAMAGAEGVELAAYADPAAKVVHVISRDGESIIERDAAGRFRYRAERGDPLKLAPMFEELRQAGRLDASGFADEAEIFGATMDAAYPDALYRLYDSLLDSGYVENRADVLVSLADGYYSGTGIFEMFVDMHSTHGALSRGGTVGFAMTTDAPFPRAQRFDELLRGFLPSSSPRR